MTGELLAPLAVLALIDSTSFGTLVIPLWLMLSPGPVRPSRVLAFLGTVAGCYLLLGIVLTAGGSTLLARFDAAADSTPVLVVQLVAGIALFVVGLTVEPLTKAGKARRAEKRAAREAERGPGRLQRWRAQATDGRAPVSALMALAVTAVLVEVLSMLPYLAAIGLLVASETALASQSLVLVGYCLVMVLPATLLLVLRVTLHQRIAPMLARIESWLSRNSRETIAWVCALLGLYLAHGAAEGLGLIS